MIFYCITRPKVLGFWLAFYLYCCNSALRFFFYMATLSLFRFSLTFAVSYLWTLGVLIKGCRNHTCNRRNEINTNTKAGQGSLLLSYSAKICHARPLLLTALKYAMHALYYNTRVGVYILLVLHVVNKINILSHKQ